MSRCIALLIAVLISWSAWTGLAEGKVAVLARSRGGLRAGSHSDPRQAARAEAQAQALSDRAKAALSRGEPALALDLYQQANAEAPRAAHLLAIAGCHRVLGNPARAAFYYRQYLKSAAAELDRTEVQDLAQRMELLATAVREEPAPVAAQVLVVAEPASAPDGGTQQPR